MAHTSWSDPATKLSTKNQPKQISYLTVDPYKQPSHKGKKKHKWRKKRDWTSFALKVKNARNDQYLSFSHTHTPKKNSNDDRLINDKAAGAPEHELVVSKALRKDWKKRPGWVSMQCFGDSTPSPFSWNPFQSFHMFQVFEEIRNLFGPCGHECLRSFFLTKNWWRRSSLV